MTMYHDRGTRTSMFPELKYTPYDRIAVCLADCFPFRGNSLAANWNADVYEVYSWETMIAYVDIEGSTNLRWTYDPRNADEVRWFDIRMSRTTKKHLNLCEQWLGMNLEFVNTDYSGRPLARTARELRREDYVAERQAREEIARNRETRRQARISQYEREQKERMKLVAKRADEEMKAWDEIIAGVKRSTKEFNNGPR